MSGLVSLTFPAMFSVALAANHSPAPPKRTENSTSASSNGGGCLVSRKDS